MSVTITINADSAYAAREEMRFLISIGASVPAVSDVSSDNGGEVSDATQGTGGKDVVTLAIDPDKAPVNKPTRGRGRPKNEGAKAEGPALNISTGDERVDPETPAVSDFAEIDVAQAKPVAEEAKVYTLDDARNAAKPYILKYTMAAASADLQSILEESVGVRAISKINPNDQTQVKKAVDALAASVNTPGPVALKLMAEEAAKKAAAEAKAA